MADEELQSLERYLLSENKVEALKLFPSTSEIKDYIVGKQLLSENPFDPKLEEILKKLSKNNEFHLRLKLRQLLKQYELTGDKELATKLNDNYLKSNFDYFAPRNIESCEVERFPSSLNIEYPDIKAALTNEKIYNSLQAAGKCSLSLSEISDPLFKKILSSGEL